MSSMFGGPAFQDPVFSVEPVSEEMVADQGPMPEELVKDWMRSRLDAAVSENATVTAQDLADGAIAHFIGYEWASQVEEDALRWAEEVLAERVVPVSVSGAMSLSGMGHGRYDPVERVLRHTPSPIFDIPPPPTARGYARITADGWVAPPTAEGLAEPTERTPLPAHAGGVPVPVRGAGVGVGAGARKRYAPGSQEDLLLYVEEKLAAGEGLDFIIEQALIEFYRLDPFFVERMVMEIAGGRRTSRGLVMHRVTGGATPAPAPARAPRPSRRYAGPDYKAMYRQHVNKLKNMLRDYEAAVTNAADAMKLQTQFEAGVLSQPLDYDTSVDSAFDAVFRDGERIVDELNSFMEGAYDSISLL